MQQNSDSTHEMKLTLGDLLGLVHPDEDGLVGGVAAQSPTLLHKLPAGARDTWASQS